MRPLALRPARALAVLALVAFAYIAVLVAVDARSSVFGRIGEAGRGLPVLAGFATVAFVLRFLRWRWLLARAGHRLPWRAGFAAYVAGFAFTATPGKLGELARIRYHRVLGVPPSRVLAAFVFERAVDLLVVVALASVAIHDARVHLLIAGFVALVFAALAAAAARPRTLPRAAASLRRRGWRGSARVVHVLGRGLAGLRGWLTPSDIAVSLALGAAAWTLLAYGLVWLLRDWAAPVDAARALSIYPAAMLAGAASFLPGGVGATEAVMVALLVAIGVDLGPATLAALTLRLASLWWAVIVGLVAMAWFEHRLAQGLPGDRLVAPL